MLAYPPPNIKVSLCFPAGMEHNKAFKKFIHRVRKYDCSASKRELVRPPFQKDESLRFLTLVVKCNLISKMTVFLKSADLTNTNC